MNYILQKVNCKALIVFVLATVLSIASASIAFAYTMRKIPNFWFDKKFVFVAENVSPREPSYSSVTISYDDLASLVYYCNEHRLSTSLVYNSAIDRYVGYVSDSALDIRKFNVSSLYGLLGNVDGKVYVAEDPRSDVHVDITIPTNPDYTDRLINIASNLDFLPIIAELNVLIADNQILLMDYIKLAIESIWDFENSMINHIDDFNTAVNNRLTYIGAKTSSIDSLLSSVINNGIVQVNTTSLDVKLAQLLGMYAEVNSVEQTTVSAAGNMITITNAIGGELQDLMFWGDTDYKLHWAERIWYTLNSTNGYIDAPDGEYIGLRGAFLGTSVPEAVSSDPMLSAGVWQNSNGTYILSDTYDAATGVYVKRVDFNDENQLVPLASAETTTYSPHTVIIPAGDSSFSAGFRLRVTFKYDQLGGVTKTADIISAIQSIPAYDDSALVSAVTTISDQITEQFGEYDSAYAFPNVLHGETSTQKLYGVLPSSFSEVPDNSDLLYSSSSSIQVYGSLIETSTEGSPDYYYEKCVPGYQSVGSSNALGYSFTIIKGTDAPAANSFIYTTMPVSFSVTDLAGTVHSFESSFSFRCSKNVAYATCSAFVYPSWDSSGTWKGWYAYYKPNFISSHRGFLLTTDGEPTVRLLTSLPDTDRYYIYSKTSEAVPVVYASRFTGFLQAQADRLVNAIGTGGAGGSGTFTVDLAPIITRLQAVTGRMDDILAQLQSTSGSATCEHTYSQHMEQEATCILPGLMISTCSKCGDSSSEIVDPLGHDWQCISHVEAVTDPDTGEETSSAYDIYTCSRCGDTYEDHAGTGAPDEDYSNTTISQLVVKVFSKLGTFAGKLIGFIVRLFDKAISSVDEVISKFNEYTEQISGFGGDYPAWLTGFWTVLPSELQVALTFAVVCMVLGIVGKKLFFS